MKLHLSSYLVGNNTKELSKWVKEQGKKILVIANALDIYPDGQRKTDGINNKNKDLITLGFSPEVLDLREYFNNQDKLREKLKDYRAFYVQGGNVFTLRQAMKLSGFDKYLLEVSKKPDYLYAGFSAGICVLAKNLKGIHLADSPNEDPYNYGKTIWEGVGLIDYMPIPHFDTPEHPESLKMYEVLQYLKKHNLPYKTMKDGDVIIEDIR